MRRAPRLPEAAALAVILVAQALLFARGLSAGALYDEGVYLGSLDALRAGQKLGLDIFAAQPPGFYLVLRGAAGVFGNTVEGVRSGVLALALVGTVAAYVALRATAGAAAGLLAAAFLTVAPPIPLYATRVLADLPALDVLLLSLAAASVAGARTTSSRAWAFAAGAAYVGACSVKLSVVVAAPVVVLLLVRQRRRADLVWAGTGALVVGTALLLLHARALPELWLSVVEYHQRLRSIGSLSASPTILDQAVHPRASFTWLLVGAAAAAVVHTWRERRLRISPFLVLAITGVLVVVWHRPLFEHHLVVASVGLALCAAEPLGRELGASSGRRRVVLAGIVGLLLVAGYAQQTRRVAAELAPEDPRVTAAVAALVSRTAAGDYVVSDQPFFAYSARRPMPGNVIDTSAARFAVGLLTDGEVLAAADETCAQAAVAGRSFTGRPHLLEELERRFATVERGPLVTLYFDRAVPC